MRQQTLSPGGMIRQRRFLLRAPVLVLPLLTLLFWSLGGGKTGPANPQVPAQNGLNTRLPEARLGDERALNKMSYYDKAAQDSDKIRQQIKSDPYSRQLPDRDTSGLHFAGANPPLSGRQKEGSRPADQAAGSKDLAGSEARVYQKLAALQTAIRRPASAGSDPKAGPGNLPIVEGGSPLKGQALTEDPELGQMNGLLEKILDIEHPERLKEKTGKVPDAFSSQFKAIPAVIDGNQKITQGSVVRIRLLDSATLNGQLIPRGQLIFGSGMLNNQRLMMTLNHIRMAYTILPVDLTVFDMTDGLEGISVPEAVTGDALRDGAVSGAEGMELMSLDPTLTAQLAGAGLNTAKGLLSKKVKRIKAKLKDGHLLLLRDNKPPAQLSGK
jgi:hypothetical protein